jgi:hypothetical protein
LGHPLTLAVHLLPNLPRPVDLAVLAPDPIDLDSKLRVPLGPSR